MATSTMKRAALMAFMAQIIASQGKAGDVNLFGNVPILQPMPLVRESGSPEAFGTYRASTRTHKRYLRKHHLGKFKKGRR